MLPFYPAQVFREPSNLPPAAQPYAPDLSAQAARR
jgi:hypothetical protein